METNTPTLQSNLEGLTSAQLILELQKLGADVNPNAKKAVLVEQLKEAAAKSAVPIERPPTPVPAVVSAEPKTEMQQMMEMMSTMVSKVDAIDKEVQRIKDGGVNDYKIAAKSEDVEKAKAANSKIDVRIVKIIENTLGEDFSCDVETFDDKPGYLLTVNVPQRLSPIAMSWRPVVDEQTGAYKVDSKTGRVVEEEYWPGDRRSVAMGSTSSFDVIQQHCNRVRAFILATYQKTNKPQPEFKTR